MPTISEQLGSPAVVTPQLHAALAAAQIHDAAMQMLVYQCDTCTGQFDEATVEGVLKRAAANTHGEAITPELEAAVRMARIRDEAAALLVYHCQTCKGEFDEATYEAVIKRAAANTHGEAITPLIEKVISAKS
jgi:DNA-directed RNA polymerase subunit RPC12/RpoP